MKNITVITSLLFLLLSLNASAMDTYTINEMQPGEVSDTIVEDIVITENIIVDQEPRSEIYYDGAPYNLIFSWGTEKKHKPKRYHLDSHWTGVGISFLNYDRKSLPESKLKRGHSYVITFNPISWKKRLFGDMLLVSGIGLDWYRYHFDSNSALTKVDGVTQFVPAPNGIKYNDSKLLSYYVTLPVLLEYHLIRNSVYVSGGVVGYVKYYSKSQVEYRTDEGKKRKENKGHDLNLRPIDMKFRLQFGVKDISAVFHYSPFSMFTKSNAPDLKVYSLGIMVNL